MAWIETHQSLISHWKTAELAEALEIKPVHAVGHLVAFWLWCIDNAPTGNLTHLKNRTIARAAQWDGDPDTFIDAMIAAHFLDVPEEQDELYIHDWQDYAGKLIDRREANAEKQREYRERNRNVTGDVPVPLRPTVQYSTQQNSTEPEDVISELALEAEPTPESSPNGSEQAKPAKDYTSNYTADQLRYATITSGNGKPKRLTPVQCKAITDLVDEVGLRAFDKALDWGGRNNILRFDPIATTARKIAKQHEPKQPRAAPEPIRGIKVSSDLTVLWCPFCEKPELQCFCGDDVLDRWADQKCARMGDRMYCTLDELEEIKHVGDPYQWIAQQSSS